MRGVGAPVRPAGDPLPQPRRAGRLSWVTLAGLTNVTTRPRCPGRTLGKMSDHRAGSCLGPGVAAPRPLAPAPGAHGRTDGQTDGRQPATAAPGPGAGFSQRLVVLWLGHFYPAFPCLPLGVSRCGEEKRGCLQLGAGLLCRAALPRKTISRPQMTDSSPKILLYAVLLRQGADVVLLLG